jgi:hypothetical protein
VYVKLNVLCIKVRANACPVSESANKLPFALTHILVGSPSLVLQFPEQSGADAEFKPSAL